MPEGGESAIEVPAPDGVLLGDAVAEADGATGSDNDGATSEALDENTVKLVFAVDDSANQTYTDGQMRWTGSFAWDETSNFIAFASSWLPTDGPYPALYDDGPISEGGHEAEGAVAGDTDFLHRGTRGHNGRRDL